MNVFGPNSGNYTRECLSKDVFALCLTNNENAFPLFEWIAKQCEVVIFSDRLSVDILRHLKPKLVISYNYIYMISKDCIDYMNGNIINMHISLLPWNRGSSPNIWSFIDNTPKGVTIHQISEGLDEGNILFQRKIDFNPDKETFETTYEKLNKEIVSLFQEHWEEIYNGTWKSCTFKQDGVGTYHTISDLKNLCKQMDFQWSENITDFLNRYHAIRTKRFI